MLRSLRDRNTQASLPVGMDIANADEPALDQVLNSSELKDIISALGVGLWLADFPDNPTFRLDHVRYGKIIFVWDKTPEGQYVSSQLQGLFNRFFYPVVAAGLVYSSTLEASGDLSEADFERTVLNRATRRLVPVLPALR